MNRDTIAHRRAGEWMSAQEPERRRAARLLGSPRIESARQDWRSEMARSYYSVVLDHSAEDVWAVIRPFDHYAWAGVESDTVIEGGKAGDQVGAVRRVVTADRTIRQVLLAHSDLDRFYAYALCEPAPLPVRNYTATIRVTPVVESGKAFVEWWATFDCAAADEVDRWIGYFELEGFATWLAALRRYMAAGKAG
jgi:hypothetical protein